MAENKIQYISQKKKESLEEEFKKLKGKKIPEIAKRIDDARQMGDLSENAEYHAAREEMAWAQSRAKEIEFILTNAEIIKENNSSSTINLGSKITVQFNDNKKDFIIVGPQEASPPEGKISNESPLGEAFIGTKAGDSVEVKVPAGIQSYKILSVN